MNQDNIGMHLKSFRKKTGISQEYMAEQLSITQPELSHIENGRRPVSQEVLTTMIESGICPDEILSQPNKLKNMVDMMDYEDQILMYEFGKRLLR